jgi:hypothetical protein
MEKKDTEQRVYAKEFKAVASAGKRGKPASRAMADLGISVNGLYRWILPV